MNEYGNPLCRLGLTDLQDFTTGGKLYVHFPRGGGALIFKSGYDARTRKQVKKGCCFFQQSMYTSTLNVISKAAKTARPGAIGDCFYKLII